MSYVQLLYHIVFRTYRSEKTIPESHERELYAYILGIANNRDVKIYRIGGMPDHIQFHERLKAEKRLSSRAILPHVQIPRLPSGAIEIDLPSAGI